MRSHVMHDKEDSRRVMPDSDRHVIDVTYGTYHRLLMKIYKYFLGLSKVYQRRPVKVKPSLIKGGAHMLLHL
jgi:hypothetical protein